jgi:hypothetical protein
MTGWGCSDRRIKPQTPTWPEFSGHVGVLKAFLKYPWRG